MKSTIVLTPGDCTVVLASLLNAGEFKVASRIFDQMKRAQFQRRDRKAAGVDEELFYHLSRGKQGGRPQSVESIIKFSGHDDRAAVKASLRRLMAAGLVAESNGEDGQPHYLSVYIRQA